MASSSFVRKGESISWDFTEPFENAYQDSPVFEIMNDKWMLKFHLYYDQQSLVNHYSINLINCNGTNLFKPFEITTYLQYKYTGKQHKCSNLTVKSAFTTLWIEKRNEIKEKLDLKYYPDGFTIICVFFPPKNNSPRSKEKNDQSTQVISQCSSSKIRDCFPLVATDKNNSIEAFSPQAASCCSNCKISDCSLLADKPSHDSTEEFENSLSNLESLSQDISGMLRNGLMADIELKCGEMIIPAHRAVLAARSEVFSSMFEDMSQNSIRNVYIEDIDSSILQEFLRYLYSGTLSRNLSSDILYNLYVTSYTYSVLSLQKECSILITKNLNAENFTTFLKIACVKDDKLLKVAIEDFIVVSPLLLKCSSWIKFSEEFPLLSIKIYKKYVEKALS